MLTIYDIIPKDLPPPVDEGYIEDHHSHDFEWYKNPDHTLSISIYDDKPNTVCWAALIGNENPRGSFLIEDGWPSYLTDIVKRITC